MSNKLYKFSHYVCTEALLLHLNSVMPGNVLVRFGGDDAGGPTDRGTFRRGRE